MNAQAFARQSYETATNTDTAPPLPNNPEAERCVLSAVLLDDKYIDEVTKAEPGRLLRGSASAHLHRDGCDG